MISATTFNTVLGANIRRARQAAGMTQQELAKACGISFQQVQKYEGGRNSLAAWRLAQFAEHLGEPALSLLLNVGAPETAAPRAAILLMRSWNAMPPAQRPAFLALARTLAGEVNHAA